jgi:hypothetical protein
MAFDHGFTFERKVRVLYNNVYSRGNFNTKGTAARPKKALTK